MALYTRLITETYIKNNSPLTDNVQMKDIFPGVDGAQNLYLRPIMGSEFMEDIKTKYDAQTLSTVEEALVVTYIQPAIMWRALALSVPFIQYNLRAKGLMVDSDDNAQPAGFSETKFMMNEIRNRAEVHEELLIKYLCDNSSDFSIYSSQDGLTLPTTKTAFDSGLIMY